MSREECKIVRFHQPKYNRYRYYHNCISHEKYFTQLQFDKFMSEYKYCPYCGKEIKNEYLNA